MKNIHGMFPCECENKSQLLETSENEVDCSAGNKVKLVTTSSNSITGVSVDYVRNTSYIKVDGYSWFAMTATYQRENIAARYLAEHGINVFYPTKHVEKAYHNQNGRVVTKCKDVSLIPNTFFIYADFRTAEKYVRYSKDVPEHLDYLRFLYDKTKVNSEGKNSPLSIPVKQMDNFIDLFSREIEGVDIVDENKIRFREGDEILITGGEFKGIKGRVARINNQTRVIVTLENVCFAATTYVPKKYIQPINL